MKIINPPDFISAGHATVCGAGISPLPNPSPVVSIDVHYTGPVHVGAPWRGGGSDGTRLFPDVRTSTGDLRPSFLQHRKYRHRPPPTPPPPPAVCHPPPAARRRQLEDGTVRVGAYLYGDRRRAYRGCLGRSFRFYFSPKRMWHYLCVPYRLYPLRTQSYHAGGTGRRRKGGGGETRVPGRRTRARTS